MCASRAWVLQQQKPTVTSLTKLWVHACMHRVDGMGVLHKVLAAVRNKL